MSDNGFDPDRPRETDGRFAEYASTPAAGTLTVPAEPDAFASDIAQLLEDGCTELEPATFDGQDVRVFRSPDGTWARAIGDPVSSSLETCDDWDDDRVREEAAAKYRIDYLSHLESKLSMDPDYDSALITAIDRLKVRDARGLVCPKGWSDVTPLRAITDFADDRLDGYDTYSQADWADVGDDYVTYGLDLPTGIVGEVVVGERDYANESESKYRERVNDALSADDYAAIDRHLKETYGCTVEANGDDGDISLTFPVSFEDTGLSADELSVEYLGDYVEAKTKLLSARNDLEYGTAMQRGIADALGYE